MELRLFPLGSWPWHTPKAETVLLDQQRPWARRGHNLLAGLVHPSLLELVGTNCPTITRLESGRTPLMRRGAVCPGSLVMCLGFLLTVVRRMSKKAEKGYSDHGDASSLLLLSGCLDISISHFHQ